MFLPALLLSILPAAELPTTATTPPADQITAVAFARETKVYTVDFARGTFARVVVRGDGSSDLDLLVLAPDGTRVAIDADSTDFCIGQFWAPRTGTYTIVVQNAGDRANLFTLSVN